MYSKIFNFLTFILFFNQEFLTSGISDENSSRILENFENPLNFVQRDEKLIGARVKRSKFEKSNQNAKLQASYLEDLAASFPKSEHELENERTASVKLENTEDDKIFKRSSISNNKKRYAQSCHMKVHRNPENRQFREYSQTYEINSNLNDYKRKNNVREPEILSTEDYYDSLNYNDDKYFQNSPRNNFGKSNYEVEKNFPSRSQKYSKSIQSEQKREVNLKNETNSNSNELKNNKNRTTEASMRLPTVRQRILTRDKRRMKKFKKHVTKNKKNKKKHKNHKKKDKRTKNNIKHSRKSKN